MPNCCKKKNRYFDSASSFDQYAPHTLLNIEHMKIALDFSFNPRRIKAGITYTIKSSTSGKSSLSELPLMNKLSQTLELNAISFEQISVSPSNTLMFTYDGSIIKIVWNTPFEKDEIRIITVNYTVSNPLTGMFFASPTEAVTSYPVYAITDHETEQARYWLACVDHPTVRSSLDFELTVPYGMVALANGSLVKEEVDAARTKKIVNWHLDKPCPSYLICVAVGQFDMVHDSPANIIVQETPNECISSSFTSTVIPIQYYAPKGLYQANDIRRAFDQTPSMITWIQKKLGVPFPWPKYFQIAAPAIGGAMENISLVTWSDKFIMDEKWASERKLYMDLVNIHEMAHTYFGDMLVIRHFEHVWMKESWATYMESVWVEDHKSKDEFRYTMFLDMTSYISETKQYMRPIVNKHYASSWSMYDAHTYPGGCWRIHMLRHLVGTETFWRGVTRYIKLYQFQKVETSDFRKCIENESGLNLVQFFDEWFHSKGFPKLKATMEVKDDHVIISVEQTQVDLANGIPFFHFTLDVEVVDEDGNVSNGVIWFTDISTRKVFLTLKIGMKKKIKSVRFDPHGKQLMTIDLSSIGEDILAGTAREASDVVSRIRAFEALLRSGTATAISKVRDAILKEQFYGVRVEVSRFLNEIRSRASLDILSALLDIERDPMAMWHLTKNCNVRDSIIREALLKFLKKGNLPYRAHEFALESLGFQSDPADIPLLIKTVTSPPADLHNFVQSGAIRGLGHYRFANPTEVQPAYDFLVSFLFPKLKFLPTGPRIAGIHSLTRALKCCEIKDSDIKKQNLIECLVSIAQGLYNPALLSHTSESRSEGRPSTANSVSSVVGENLGIPDSGDIILVRKAAVNALVSLNESHTQKICEFIENLRPMFAKQDSAWIDAKLVAVKSLGISTDAKIEKKVEDLEEKLKKMEEKILQLQGKAAI